ncbi:hypothetical protein M514_06213 [Trichuris suis]|uniref:Secreted protein n=1 Tax=Trichuris suis TaxID=68888 RepID=A0A085N2M2_9BILA|nr:hypothetical protein M513_06213 [Trichuris suis]KFD63718.1 hypothetical protein M514_06213 [Trichuris suis]
MSLGRNWFATSFRLELMFASAQPCMCESSTDLLLDCSGRCDSFAVPLDFQGKVSLLDTFSGYHRCNGLINCDVAVSTMATHGLPSWPEIIPSTRTSGQNNRF